MFVGELAIEGRSLQFRERSDHLVVLGVQSLWKRKPGFGRYGAELCVVVRMVRYKHLSKIFDILR